jgi:hypothetical protein
MAICPTLAPGTCKAPQVTSGEKPPELSVMGTVPPLEHCKPTQ